MRCTEVDGLSMKTSKSMKNTGRVWLALASHPTLPGYEARLAHTVMLGFIFVNYKKILCPDC